MNDIPQQIELDNGTIVNNPQYLNKTVEKPKPDHKNNEELNMLRERQKEIQEMKAEGKSYAKIAKEYNISRQRVHQIINQKYERLNIKLTNY